MTFKFQLRCDAGKHSNYGVLLFFSVKVINLSSIREIENASGLFKYNNFIGKLYVIQNINALFWKIPNVMM